MNRNEFLMKIGLGFTLTNIQFGCKKENSVDPITNNGDCIVSDTETDGPYPLYNQRGDSITHVDIREDRTGIPLNIQLTVKDSTKSCAIIPNAEVVIWHCDKDGYYSGYSNNGYLGTQNNTGKTFCRGIGYTGNDGIVKFITVYPGWYQGRATHIHLQVYIDNVLKKTTQMCFPEEINTEVHSLPLYASHGQNTTKNTQDNILSDSLDNELAEVKKNGEEYDCTHSIVI